MQQRRAKVPHRLKNGVRLFGRADITPEHAAQVLQMQMLGKWCGGRHDQEGKESVEVVGC